MTSSMRWLSARQLGIVAALVAAGCAKDKENETAAQAKPVVVANTVTVSVEPFTRTVKAIGVVVARPGHFAALSAPSPTRVAKIFVAGGQRVGAGTPLVEFDQATFSATASATEAAYSAAQKNYERAQRLANEGILPRKDAETALAELGKTRADAVAAQRAQQLSVLRSPINGVVTGMRAVLGAPADAGQVLVEIADPSAFDVLLSLAATDAGAVLPGAKGRLSAGEKTGGEALGEGRVSSVGAALDTVSRAVGIRVPMASPKRALRLGESVFGDIAISTKNSVVIPVEALVPGEEVGTYKVFVVDAKGTATSRDVKIGGRDESRVEIVDGLKGGEKVVTQGAFGVQDSSKVTKELPVKDSAAAGAKSKEP